MAPVSQQFWIPRGKSVTESRMDHKRACSRRDHLVLQPPIIPTYGRNIQVNGQASKESHEDHHLPEETLHTVLVEAEATINSRLLSMVSDDIINMQI